MFRTPTTRRSAVSCPTCSGASSGWKAKTAGSRCACPTPRCVRSTRTASKSCSRICALAGNTSDSLKETDHARKDQARILGRYGPFLHDDEEQEADAGEDGDQE